jgi:hypothetical protein
LPSEKTPRAPALGRQVSLRYLASLHVHLDGSGPSRFTEKSPRYHVFATARTYEPFALAQTWPLTNIAYKEVATISKLSAQKDHKHHRGAVVSIMAGHSNWK